MTNLDKKLDVRVYPINEPQTSTKAFASVSVEDLIAIRGIRVVEGSKGLFVTMPQSKDQDGNYHDIAFPVTADLRKAVNKAIIDEFKTLTQVAEKSAEPKIAEPASKPTPSEPEL